MVVKNKYHDVTGEPKEATASKKKKGEGEDGARRAGGRQLLGGGQGLRRRSTERGTRAAAAAQAAGVRRCSRSLPQRTPSRPSPAARFDPTLTPPFPLCSAPSRLLQTAMRSPLPRRSRQKSPPSPQQVRCCARCGRPARARRGGEWSMGHARSVHSRRPYVLRCSTLPPLQLSLPCPAPFKSASPPSWCRDARHRRRRGVEQGAGL